MTYAFEGYVLDETRYELTQAGQPCAIERQTFDILRHLIAHRDRVVTRDELFEAIWSGRAVSDSALSSQIKAARKAVGDDGEKQNVIRTVHGRGFRFVAEVSNSEPEAHSPSIQPSNLHQEIRYTTARDGVRIAYADVGAGPVLLKAANWLSHLEFEWESPIWRHWITGLAQKHRYIRYDQRSNGLSDRSVDDVSFEAMTGDLEAVADVVAADQFALLGVSQGCAMAIDYAVRHPDRVSHLILYGGFAQGWRARGDAREIERREAMKALMRSGWGKSNPVFRQMFTGLFMPNVSTELAAAFNELQRQSAWPDDAAHIYESVGRIDVRSLLDKVRTPTLVLHARKDESVPFEAGRVLATHIPNARLVTLESENHILLADEPAFARLLDEVHRFLSETPG